MNFFKTVEDINARIDPTNPSDADLLEIAEVCRWFSVRLDENRNVIACCAPIARSTFFSNYGTHRIREATNQFARRYRGGNAFMRDMRDRVVAGEPLTIAQAAAVLNVMIRRARANQRHTGDLKAA